MGKPTNPTIKLGVVLKVIFGSFLLASVACRSATTSEGTSYYETVSTNQLSAANANASVSTTSKVWFKNHSMRLETMVGGPAPISLITIIHNGQFYLLDPIKKTAKTTPSAPQNTTLPGGLFSQMPRNLKLFAQREIEGGRLAGQDQIDGIPADRYEVPSKTSLPMKNTVWVSKNNGWLLRVIIERTDLQSKTTMDFKNAVIGGAIADSQFAVPSDFTIIS